MPDERYPYENIEMTNLLHNKEERYKSPKKIPGPKKRNRNTHGVKIKKNIDDIKQTIINTAKKKGIDPSLIFKIKYDKKVTDEVLKRYGCDLLGDLPGDGNCQVVFSNPERLNQFFEKLKLYKDGELTDKDNPQHSTFFNKIYSLSRLEPKDRKGPKLSQTKINRDKDYWVDIELWYGENKDDCRKNQNNLEKLIGNLGKITDDYIGDSIHLLRAQLKGCKLLELLDRDRVCQIEFPPKSIVNTFKKINTELEELTIENTQEDAVGICVIDSGVSPGHELIKNALADYSLFREDLEDGIDESGHGTFVAGIALYGDIQKCVESKEFIPHAKLYSARVTDKNNNLGPKEKIYIKQIRKAIIHYHEKYNCRIFNVSLGNPDSVFSGQQYQSNWAHILDNLARKRNIIIVISTGNISSFNFKDNINIQGEEIIRHYPSYLYKEEAGLLDPATATNCISELRTSKGLCDPSEKSHGISRLIISRKGQPSPFTRTGFGFNDTIKPDFVAYGGNMCLNGLTKKLIDDVQTGVYSLNYDFIKEHRLFSASSGTSFAAPYISHLVAGILNYNKSYSNNTVRVLLANSADYQNETKDLLKEYMNEIQDQIIEVLGKLKDEQYCKEDKEIIDVINKAIDKGSVNTIDKKKLLKSVTIPEKVKDILKLVPINESEIDRYLLRLSGYGYPDVNRAVFSSENKVTLYAEKEIELDKFDVYEIPIPQEYIEKKGLRKIIISLAYTPATRHKRKDYCGYNITFELIRGKSFNEVLQIAGNDTKKENYTTLNSKRCSLIPNRSLIKNSTLKKAAFEMKRAPNAYGNTYYLVVTCENKWLKDSIDYISTNKEKYSVVVTLEH